MKLIARSVPPGTKVVDRDAPVTRAQAKEIKASGAKVIMRCLNHITIPSADATRQEVEDICAEGLGVAFYEQFLHDAPFNADTGKARAAGTMKQLRALFTADEDDAFRRVTCCGDLEASKATNEGGVAFLMAWNQTSVDARGAADQYLSSLGFDLTTQQLAASALRLAWRSGAKPHQDPPQGYVLLQSPSQTTIGDVVVDLDTSTADATGALLIAVFAEGSDAPSPAPEGPPRPPQHAPDAIFTFQLHYDEPLGDRCARCMEEMLAGGPMGHTVRPDWYASCVNVTHPAGILGGQPVSSIAAWATSCLIMQEAVDNHCGRQPQRVPINGEGFFYDARTGHGVYREADMIRPASGQLPSRGDVYYVSHAGVNDGHVVRILKRLPDGSWLVAGGGGGTDGTLCSISTWQADPKTGLPMDPPPPHGLSRPPQGWWKPIAELPPSPKAPPAPRPDPPQPAPQPQPAPAKPSDPLPAPPGTKPSVPTASPSRHLVTGSIGAWIMAALQWGEDHPVAVIAIGLVVVLLAIALVVVLERRASRGTGKATVGNAVGDPKDGQAKP